MYGLARPFLFGLDAERAHGLTLAALDTAYRTGLNPLVSRLARPLPTKAFGLDFPNPVGLAAGLDKNGAHIDALFALGIQPEEERSREPVHAVSVAHRSNMMPCASGSASE